MQFEKLKPLAKGLAIRIPGVIRFVKSNTGGTINSRYCYAVWLRHLIMMHKHNNAIPERIAELGPGDSLGIGIAALLSGCRQYFASDVIQFWDVETNLKVFDELVTLFKNKSPIPDDAELPRVMPKLESYEFPAYIISDDQLQDSLKNERLNRIGKEISDPVNADNKHLCFHFTHLADKEIKDGSLDLVFSQAVLEHVEDLGGTYHKIKKWLKPGGYSSHTIDFKSHGITKSWNGHWTFTDFEWKIVRAGRTYLINRAPLSAHLLLHDSSMLNVLEKQKKELPNDIPHRKLSKRFKALSGEDLTTSDCYILSKKSLKAKAMPDSL